MGRGFIPLPTGGSGGGAAKSDVWDLVDYEWITVNGTWDKMAALAAHVPGYAMDDIRLDIDIIGGGSSGYCCSSGPGAGGPQGGVRRLSKLHPDELAETVAAVIGAGGAAIDSGSKSGSFYAANPGGATSFGPWSAPGGNRASNSFLMSTATMPSDVPLGAPGAGNTSSVAPSAAMPSFGPGGGGAGGWQTGPGLSGGNACVDRPTSKTLGGQGVSDAAGQPGVDAFDAWGFGSGAAGGAAHMSAGLNCGGKGGFPGGGGGGGGRDGIGADNRPLNGGAGGNGAVRIRYFVRRGAVAA
jgi:hypothetical protein